MADKHVMQCDVCGIDVQSNEGTSSDADATAAHTGDGDMVDIQPQLISSFQHGFDQLKESSVDDNIRDTISLLPTALASPLHDCVVLDNQVAMEMQGPFTDSHNKHKQQNETSFVTHGNIAECDGCSVITNKQPEPDNNSSLPNLGSVNSKPDEPGYKPLANQRDVLFPMRDQRSILEIKQVSKMVNIIILL